MSYWKKINYPNHEIQYFINLLICTSFVLFWLLLILCAPGENTLHGELICSAIQCIKLTPQRVD